MLFNNSLSITVYQSTILSLPWCIEYVWLAICLMCDSIAIVHTQECYCCHKLGQFNSKQSGQYCDIMNTWSSNGIVSKEISITLSLVLSNRVQQMQYGLPFSKKSSWWAFEVCWLTLPYARMLHQTASDQQLKIISTSMMGMRIHKPTAFWFTRFKTVHLHQQKPGEVRKLSYIPCYTQRDLAQTRHPKSCMWLNQWHHAYNVHSLNVHSLLGSQTEKKWLWWMLWG